jgi:glycerophosphoryl diester phosphodiesterase
MHILSHRGYWQTAAEKNTETAFHRSFSLGFGTETDVRDALGELVISHDPPIGGEMKFSYFLEIYNGYKQRHSQPLPLALNVKADGLQSRLKLLLEQYEITNYFMFDMSVPDAKLYDVLESHIKQNKQVCLVSPDLHKRSYQEFWQKLKAMAVVRSPEITDKVMLCTDFPEAAKLLFTDNT